VKQYVLKAKLSLTGDGGIELCQDAGGVGDTVGGKMRG